MNICPLNVESESCDCPSSVPLFQIKGCFPSQVISDNVICAAPRLPVSSPRLRLCREWNMDF